MARRILSLSPRRHPDPATLAQWQRDLLGALTVGALLAVALLGWRATQPTAAVDAVAPLPPASLAAPAGPPAPPSSPPWGTLTAEDHWIRPPAELVHPDQCGAIKPWRWPGMTAAALQALLDQAGLPAALAQSFRTSSACDAQGCLLNPTAAQRLALPATARAVIYASLASHSENDVQAYAFRFAPPQVDAWLEAGGLPLPLRARLRQLMYPERDTLSFADQDSLCVGLPAAERSAVVAALTTVHGERVWLRVAAGQPVDALARYWGEGGREAVVRPLLERLAQQPAGGTIDVSELLPPFAAARVNQHPRPTDPDYNCHYSALNFFRETPDERLVRVGNVPPALASDFTEGSFPDHLGNVIVITKPDGTVLHSMAYVAADYVFTKNGYAHSVPWVLSRIDDVRRIYHGTVTRERLFRRKGW